MVQIHARLTQQHAIGHSIDQLTYARRRSRYSIQDRRNAIQQAEEGKKEKKAANRPSKSVQRDLQLLQWYRHKVLQHNVS
jgi:hypothetical protein